ncbi:glycosyltransferase involved in cell wall biosynthesis [Anaerotaenia torta]|uniref:glycosyltransferase n=1 Tax=Anaerotaenia torta TaxID=433293 RepID=UPI003D1C9447
MGKTIGVVVATYNGQKYVAEQLVSIINQSKKPDLIIVSDGKSLDLTVEICNEILSGGDIPFEVLTSEVQLSVAENFQKGLAACDCDYIFFSDQDDVWLPNKIEIVIQQMEKHQTCMAFSNAQIVDAKLNDEGRPLLWESVGYEQLEDVKVYGKGNIELISILIRHNIVTGMCMCISRDFRNKVMPLSQNAIHDSWIAIIAANVGSIVAIKEKCVLYRQHGNNVVGTTTNICAALKNRKLYAIKVKKRELMIREVIKRVFDETDEESLSILNDYVSFLKERNRFIDCNNGFFFPIKSIKWYQKYEYNHKQIIIKDYITRITNQG